MRVIQSARPAWGLLATLFGGAIVVGTALIQAANATPGDSRRRQTPQDLVWANDEWAAFSAEFEERSAAGSRRGVIAQKGNGSSVRVWIDAKGEPVQISIFNTQHARFYRATLNQWTAQPLEFDAKPARAAIDVRRNPRVPADDPRVAGLAGRGLTFYEQRARNGIVNIISPELNLRSIWYDDGRGTAERWLSIALGEPPDTLFEPPPGSKVQTVPDVVRKGRIVRRSSEEASPRQRGPAVRRER